MLLGCHDEDGDRYQDVSGDGDDDRGDKRVWSDEDSD